jgi:D-lyxose ketol-isomerase
MEMFFTLEVHQEIQVQEVHLPNFAKIKSEHVKAQDNLLTAKVLTIWEFQWQTIEFTFRVFKKVLCFL